MKRKASPSSQRKSFVNFVAFNEESKKFFRHTNLFIHKILTHEQTKHQFPARHRVSSCA
jgi:hypothetical protein